MKKRSLDTDLQRATNNNAVETIENGDKMARAQARKDHMLALSEAAKNEQSKSSIELSESKKHSIRKKAQEKMDQNEDIVKLLNTYGQRAVAFAIRDHQMVDKKAREEEEKNYERRMDLTMELDRLKEMKRREEAQHQKIVQRIEDRKVIEDQILKRHQQKILLEEEREQENVQMLSAIQKYKDADEEKAKLRKEESKKAQLEVIRLNLEAVETKQKQLLLVKEEDDKIIAYQKQKDEKLRRREIEEAEADRKKQELQKKMLENQTKSMDRQAEIDELRARRAMEEKERTFRQKELQEAQKRKRDMKILHEARSRQEEERRVTKEKLQKMKEEEYKGAIKLAADMAKREKDEVLLTEKKNAAFRTALQQQIGANEIERRARQQDKRDEGRKIKENKEIERTKLEAIRDKMVSDMKAKGVNEKYFGEMKSMDIDKFLRK